MRPLPSKAIVLAAGLGKRLRPLTDVTPKPLLPVWGEPMLKRTLDMLVGWGVSKIAVNAHHLHEKIESFVDAYRASPKGRAVEIEVSYEPEILGTGGVLRPLADFISSDPFWLVNGDVVIDGLDPKPIARAFEESGDFAGCWISEAGPRTIEADPQGRVCNWKSDDAGYPGTYTYCGVAMLSPEVLGYLPDRPFASIVEAYEKAMYQDARFVVGSVQAGAFWWDAGTVENFRKVNDGPQPAELYGDSRLDALVARLGWKLGDTAAEFLAARGSDRSFWRLAGNGSTAIAIEWSDGKRPENDRYAAHARALAALGVPVPAVLAELPEERIAAFEDLGDDSLEKRANAPKAEKSKLYAPVVEALAAMHVKGAAASLELEPAFGPELYAWERELFAEHIVRGRFAIDALPDDVAVELEALASELGGFRPVLVHRDFQSSNVLYRGNSPVFIDFQGMRMGPAAYDLASLLFDSYVDLSAVVRDKLLDLYSRTAVHLGGDAVSGRELALGAVQRTVQALGAFGRLSAAGQAGFERRIPRALELLVEAAGAAGLDATCRFAKELAEREGIRRGRFPGTHHEGPCSCGHHH